MFKNIFSNKKEPQFLINGRTKSLKDLVGKSIIIYQGIGYDISLFEIQLKINGYNDEFVTDFDIRYMKFGIWPVPFDIYPVAMPKVCFTFSQFSNIIHTIISSWKKACVENSNSLQTEYNNYLQIKKGHHVIIEESIFAWSIKQQREMTNTKIKDIENTVKLYQNLFEDLNNYESAIIAGWPKLA